MNLHRNRCRRCATFEDGAFSEMNNDGNDEDKSNDNDDMQQSDN